MTRSLQEAIKRGRLNDGDLRRLISHEARQLGLSTEQALRRARANKLPDSTIGIDLRMLVSILDSRPA
jgi:hypothetical protein